MTADPPPVFPTERTTQELPVLLPVQAAEELTAWNNLFLPITQGS